MKKVTKKQFIERCKELNVIWEDNGYGLIIYPPKGKVFNSFLTHSEMIHFNDSWKMNEIYAELLYYMKDGLSDCPDIYCEYCNSL